MLAESDFDHVALPAHTLAPQVPRCHWDDGPDHSIDRHAEFPTLLAQLHGHVRIIAEAGVEPSEPTHDLPTKKPARARYDRQNAQARGGEPPDRELHGILDFLQPREQRGGAIEHANI